MFSLLLNLDSVLFLEISGDCRSRKVDEECQHHQNGGDGKGHTEFALLLGIDVEGNSQSRTGAAKSFDESVQRMGKACGKQQRSRFTQNSAHGQDAAGDDTIHTTGQNHRANHSPLTGTQTESAFPVGLRNGLQAFLGLSIIYSFILLTNVHGMAIPIICWAIHPLKDIFMVSDFWLLCMKL